MKFAVLFAAAGMTVLLTACGPELARTPYTAEETEWMNYLQQQYPGWRPPQTPPPVAGAVAPAPVVAAEENGLFFEDSGKREFELVSDTGYSDGAFVSGETANAESAAPGYVEYTVKKGDTLGGISRQFYKKAGRWKQIYNANTNVISNPNQLKVGTVLRIPQP